jgi:hypothetical protein
MLMSDVHAHHNALLMRRRCGWCAEPVPLRALLRGKSCPRCDADLRRLGSADGLTDALVGRWWGLRLVGYGLVATASFVSGTVPMLQTVVLAAGLLVLHVLLIRSALGWLPPARRITGRFTIKLVGALLTAIAFVVNVAVAPLLGVSSLILAAVGFLLSVAYVESALWLIRRRVAWETASLPLQVREWLLPAGLTGALLLVVGGSIGVAVGGLHLLATTDLPGISTLAEWMLDA